MDMRTATASLRAPQTMSASVRGGGKLSSHRRLPVASLVSAVVVFLAMPVACMADAAVPAYSDSGPIGARILDVGGNEVPDGYVVVPKDGGLPATTYRAEGFGSLGVDPEHYVTGPEYEWETAADPAGIVTSTSSSDPQALTVSVATSWQGPVYTRTCCVTWMVHSRIDGSTMPVCLPATLIVEKSGVANYGDSIAIAFTSNHQGEGGASLLKTDKEDFSNVGNAYNDGNSPDWCPGMKIDMVEKGNPASFTRSTKITVKAKVTVTPQGIPFVIKGEAADGHKYVQFKSDVLTATGAKQEVALTADEKLPDAVKFLEAETINWKIGPPGSDGAARTKDFGMAKHDIFVLYGEPKQNAIQLFAYFHLKQATTWAKDCKNLNTSNDADNIPRQVQIGVKAWNEIYTYCSPGRFGIQRQDVEINDNFQWIYAKGGDCLTYARLMTEAMLILGIDADWKYIVCRMDDVTINTAYAISYTWSDKPKLPFHYYFSTPGGNGIEWNFHGACACAGNWWEITFNSVPDHDVRGNSTNGMLKWPNGPVIQGAGKLMDPAEALYYWWHEN